MNKILTLLFSFLVFTSALLSQDSSFFYYHSDMPSQPYAGQIGGLALPSAGQLRVLIVFVQFPDDEYDTQNVNWPKGGNPLNWQYWLDQSWTDNPTPGSLTDYFSQMSVRKLKVIGEEVSLTTLHSREWYYLNNKKRYDIHKEILQQQLDPTWDFSQFDNWTFSGNYSHSEGPDGKIDFVFFIWRNIAMELDQFLADDIMEDLNMYWAGNMGGQGRPNIDVDNGLRYFNPNDFGSGCTLPLYFYKDAFRFAIHEFAHYLIGHNNYHMGHAFWAMLSGYEVRSFMINAWERHRLGWGNIITINKNTHTYPDSLLQDFITTGKAYRIEIDAASNQYIFLENHQKISPWDKCSDSIYPDDKGIFVYRQDGMGGASADWLKFIPGDGRYDWTVTRWVNDHGIGDGGYLPVFQKGSANRATGYSPTDYHLLLNQSINKYGYYDVLLSEGTNGNYISYPLRLGQGKDAFRSGFNEVFSPWSNPSSQDKNRNSTGIGFKLKFFWAGVAVIDIYINTAKDAPPSKPINFNGNFSGTHPVLIWSANIEPDLMGYRVYKKLTLEAGGSLTTYVFTTSTSYTDNDFTKSRFSHDNAEYWVVAVDSTNKLSLGTDHYMAYGLSNIQWKISGLSEESYEYSLLNNYPNPFNPTTQIEYHVFTKGLASIKVYNILGTEVANLVNEVKPVGKYIVSFDASKLPSGVYIYTYSINDFVQSKKMTLIK